MKFTKTKKIDLRPRERKEEQTQKNFKRNLTKVSPIPIGSITPSNFMGLAYHPGNPSTLM